LVADSNGQLGEQVKNELRNAGLQVRLTVIDDLSDIGRCIASGGTDLVLLRGGITELQQVRSALAGQEIPILLAVTSDKPVALQDALQAGAVDVVAANAPVEVALVARRELGHAFKVRDYTRMQRALREAEQRCQLLLEKTTAFHQCQHCRH
jgi:CheY-like chemotaxis protein